MSDQTASGQAVAGATNATSQLITSPHRQSYFSVLTIEKINILELPSSYILYMLCIF